MIFYINKEPFGSLFSILIILLNGDLGSLLLTNSVDIINTNTNISANGSLTKVVNVQLTDYAPIGIIGYSLNHSGADIINPIINGQQFSCIVQNRTGNVISFDNFKVIVLYIKKLG